MIEVIGWASSSILILTIATQIAKQWRDKTSAGVSTWLFVGQLGASVGFTIYSLLVKNWVFAVTNGIMVLNGLIGYGITVRHKRNRTDGTDGTDGTNGSDGSRINSARA